MSNIFLYPLKPFLGTVVGGRRGVEENGPAGRGIQIYPAGGGALFAPGGGEGYVKLLKIAPKQVPFQGVKKIIKHV